MVVDINVFYTFNMGDNIRVNCIGGWQGQLDGGDHRGRWHHDVSLQLESLVINRPLLATFSSYSTFMMSWTLVLSNTLKLSNTEMHSPSALLITSPSSLKNILIEVIHHDVTNLYGLLHPIESVNNFHVNHHNHSISHPSWRKFQMMWYILTLCQRPPLSMSLFSLPTAVPSTTNPHILYVARHVENINNSHLNHHHHSISRPNWRKFLPKWYILMSATSLVISSRLFLPSTVLSTTNSHVLNVVRHVDRIKNSHLNHHHHSTSHPC